MWKLLVEDYQIVADALGSTFDGATRLKTIVSIIEDRLAESPENRIDVIYSISTCQMEMAPFWHDWYKKNHTLVTI